MLPILILHTLDVQVRHFVGQLSCEKTAKWTPKNPACFGFTWTIPCRSLGLGMISGLKFFLDLKVALHRRVCVGVYGCFNEIPLAIP